MKEPEAREFVMLGNSARKSQNPRPVTLLSFPATNLKVRLGGEAAYLAASFLARCGEREYKEVLGQTQKKPCISQVFNLGRAGRHGCP